jgi:hypothetical protein
VVVLPLFFLLSASSGPVSGVVPSSNYRVMGSRLHDPAARQRRRRHARLPAPVARTAPEPRGSGSRGGAGPLRESSAAAFVKPNQTSHESPAINHRDPSGPFHTLRRNLARGPSLARGVRWHRVRCGLAPRVGGARGQRRVRWVTVTHYWVAPRRCCSFAASS